MTEVLDAHRDAIEGSTALEDLGVEAGSVDGVGAARQTNLVGTGGRRPEE